MGNRHTRNLKDIITCWPTSESSFDGQTFGAPYKQFGRWEDRIILFQTPTGEQVNSNAVVYLTSDVEVGDYIAPGDFTGPNLLEDPTQLVEPIAYRVKRFDKVSNIRNVEMERKVFV